MLGTIAHKSKAQQLRQYWKSQECNRARIEMA
jgi:hypothetical protein